MLQYRGGKTVLPPYKKYFAITEHTSLVHKAQICNSTSLLHPPPLTDTPTV